MPKRQLTAVEQFQLRQALHIATLSALLSAQRWAPHDLIFQGGTSLHLSHGSPRYSEDLDFLVKQSLDVARINSHIESQLKYLPWIPAEGVLSVTHTKSGRNPHAFNVVIGGENLIPAVKVKVELWKTPDRAMTPLDVQVSSVQAAVGLAAGMRVAVPTATQAEIYVDKVFALAARDFLKPRDMFDLHWLKEQDSSHRCTPEALALRLEAYPSNTPHDWTSKALKRLSDLPEQAAFIGNDLKKWLPSIYPIDVQAMITTAIQALDDGMACMRQVRQASGSYDEASKR
jgi:predicted nucleotidyltransferase component of viral defense system